MAGLHEISFKTLDQFLRRYASAGYQREWIEAIAGDDKSFIGAAEGAAAVINARRWLEEILIKLYSPSISTAAIPGIKAKYIRSRDEYTYLCQEYGMPHDILVDGRSYDQRPPLAEGYKSTREEYKLPSHQFEDYSFPFEKFNLSCDDWSPFIDGWEAQGLFDQPQLFLIRRIPRPKLWIKMAPGWEARFTQNRGTQDRNFELRPYIKVFP